MEALTLLGGRYRLGAVLGRGGMGTVHRARDERLGRDVAVKVLRAGSGEVAAERLRREAQYLAGLMHPNLVAVLDAGADGPIGVETLWFAMELVDGPDLCSVLQRSGPLDGAALRRVLQGVLDALTALHGAGVVHRDLKPANVLLTGDPADGPWDVKLTDLGIAHRLSTEHLTSTGQVIGTVAYLSPEQIAGAEVGPAADVYALGLLAIEALTGRPAFDGRPTEAAAARLVRGPLLPSALEPRWAGLLAAMTAVDPDDRPTTVRLRAAVAGLPDAALEPEVATQPFDLSETALIPLPAAGPATGSHRPSRRPGRRRRRVLAAAGALLVLGSAGGGALLARVAPASAESDPGALGAQAHVTPVLQRSTGTPTATPAPSRPTATTTPSPAPTTPATATAERAPSAERSDRQERSERSERLSRMWRRISDRVHQLRHHGSPHDR